MLLHSRKATYLTIAVIAIGVLLLVAAVFTRSTAEYMAAAFLLLAGGIMLHTGGTQR